MTDKKLTIDSQTPWSSAKQHASYRDRNYLNPVIPDLQHIMTPKNKPYELKDKQNIFKGSSLPGIKPPIGRKVFQPDIA